MATPDQHQQSPSVATASAAAVDSASSPTTVKKPRLQFGVKKVSPLFKSNQNVLDTVSNETKPGKAETSLLVNGIQRIEEKTSCSSTSASVVRTPTAETCSIQQAPFKSTIVTRASSVQTTSVGSRGLPLPTPLQDPRLSLRSPLQGPRLPLPTLLQNPRIRHPHPPQQYPPSLNQHPPYYHSIRPVRSHSNNIYPFHPTNNAPFYPWHINANNTSYLAPPNHFPPPMAVRQRNPPISDFPGLPASTAAHSQPSFNRVDPTNGKQRSLVMLSKPAASSVAAATLATKPLMSLPKPRTARLCTLCIFENLDDIR